MQWLKDRGKDSRSYFLDLSQTHSIADFCLSCTQLALSTVSHGWGQGDRAHRAILFPDELAANVDAEGREPLFF